MRVRAQAPLVAAGLQLDYWEAGGRVGAARSGMEIQNHWGHVDAHVQLSVRPPLVHLCYDRFFCVKSPRWGSDHGMMEVCRNVQRH